MEPHAEPPDAATSRIQLCGRLAATVDGRPLDEALAGREERVLFTYLVLHRLSPLDAATLAEVIWPAAPPADAADQVSRLLRRLRRLLGRRLELRPPSVQLRLPVDSTVDVEVAAEAIHRAEAAVARGDWTTAWPAARVALHTVRRPFMPGVHAPWVEAQRRRLRDVELRAHECIAATGLGLGGNEVSSAERSARALIEREPLRESGYRFLMTALARRGDLAEALQTFTDLARRLEAEAGIGPSAATTALRDSLTRAASEAAPSAATIETASRAFMFTDICDSTSLVSTIGDQAWRHMLQWHDRLVDEVIAAHHGEIMDRAGDGVFAAFERPADAVRCAVTLQARLAAHRVEHGFAPFVRIGVHADRAVPARGKYAGRGVHLAARVAALARAGEIVLTGSTADGTGVTLRERRAVELKGLPDPVEVGLLRWE